MNRRTDVILSAGMALAALSMLGGVFNNTSDLLRFEFVLIAGAILGPLSAIAMAANRNLPGLWWALSLTAFGFLGRIAEALLSDAPGVTKAAITGVYLCAFLVAVELTFRAHESMGSRN